MKKILVVDDDEEFLETLSIVLVDNGFQVETTSTQDDIYELILQFDPHVILLDIHLNGADGRNICMGLKNHFRTKEIPIILCSGDQEMKDKYPDYMAEDFIEKPMDLDKLVSRLNAYCKL